MVKIINIPTKEEAAALCAKSVAKADEANKKRPVKNLLRAIVIFVCLGIAVLSIVFGLQGIVSLNSFWWAVLALVWIAVFVYNLCTWESEHEPGEFYDQAYEYFLITDESEDGCRILDSEILSEENSMFHTLRLTVADKRGYVRERRIDGFIGEEKIGIDDTVVDLDKHTIYLPYKIKNEALPKFVGMKSKEENEKQYEEAEKECAEDNKFILIGNVIKAVFSIASVVALIYFFSTYDIDALAADPELLKDINPWLRVLWCLSGLIAVASLFWWKGRGVVEEYLPVAYKYFELTDEGKNGWKVVDCKITKDNDDYMPYSVELAMVDSENIVHHKTLKWFGSAIRADINETIIDLSEQRIFFVYKNQKTLPND